MANKLIIDTLRTASKGEAQIADFFDESVSGGALRDLNTSLRAAANTTTVFLISDELNISLSLNRLVLSDRMEREAGSTFLRDNLKLTTNHLRRIFTFFEYVIYFLCKFPKYHLDPSYDEKTETFSERLKILKEGGKIDKETEKKLRAIKSTRDQFAHSFIDIKELFYEGEALQSKQLDFFNDVDATAIILEDHFREHQHHQVDWPTFNLVMRALSAARKS
ncbi:hypothetical protein GCM10011363_34840 [Marivita lacus]|uniref:Cthe-2314-like HEPN domain-containing protein n=1 Tax=Marivita lacus TaxID=1323742 RepID=A0ABQ1L0I0_9RHOB|nr:hypothetical protein [Marivita lacus]GGC15397.1 hypothetical protein GCM10011363_34840 [Marivita lacus]